MKIAPRVLTFALTLCTFGCADSAEVPTESEHGSTTHAEPTGGSGGESGDDPDDGSTTEATEATGTSTGDADSSSSTGMPSDGHVDYFIGTSANFLADGTPTATDRILARRQLDPAGSQIFETLYLVAPDDTWQRFDLVQEVDVVADTFAAQFETEFGTIEVAGEYTSGDDWAWDAWRSTSTYVDGLSEGWVVTSEDLVVPEGGHRADKQVLDPNGQVMFIIEERLDAVDSAAYDAAVAELE